MISFSCLSCFKHLSTTDDKAGKATVCPTCGARIVVPRARPVWWQDGLPTERNDVQAAARPDPLPVDRKERAGQGNLSLTVICWLLVAAIAAIALLVVVSLGFENIYLGILILVVLGGVCSAINQQRLHQEELTAALRAYEASLDWLKTSPNNPEARQLALRLGRAYYDLTRNKKGVTIYDEVAIKNDIDAACAGTVTLESR